LMLNPSVCTVIANAMIAPTTPRMTPNTMSPVPVPLFMAPGYPRAAGRSTALATFTTRPWIAAHRPSPSGAWAHREPAPHGELVVVVQQDSFETFAKFNLLPSYASRAAEAAEIHLGWLADTEIEPDVRSAVWVGRRIVIRIFHALNDSAKSVPERSSFRCTRTDQEAGGLD
jgi:hypothetical protein